MKIKKIPLFFVLIAYLSGCSGARSVPLPRAIVDEMNLLGTTIFTEEVLGAADVNPRFDSTVEPPQIIGQINLFMTPRSADSVISLDGILSEGLEIIPYRFTFSAEVDGTYMEIPPSNVAHYSASSSGSYSGHLIRHVNDVELHGEGNYVLTSSRQLRIPTTATHVELWFQSDGNVDKELVRRVPLSSLSEWRKWFNVDSSGI